MKKIITLISIVLFTGLTATVSAQCSKKCASSCTGAKTTKAACDEKVDKAEVKAYYFHATRRCATCQAVEEVTSKAIKESYGEKVAFVSINREENKDNPLIKKHNISGQTLLLIKGDKVVNLTNDAFMYARNKPEKFEKKLKSTLDEML